MARPEGLNYVSPGQYMPYQGECILVPYKLNSFNDLGLIEPLRRAVAAEGYTTPTPVQAHAIPPALLGLDILGVAQTGTGKTAAFTLPILQRLKETNLRPDRNCARALILTPTRELAIQIGESIHTYGRHLGQHYSIVYGGVSQRPQVSRMRRGVDILIATPGRLLDLMNQGYIYLDQVETFVLDEADRMLDMGFIHDVRIIVAELPQERQTLFFSATMPSAIVSLAEQILSNYEHIDIRPAAKTVDRVEQRVLFVEKSKKRKLLCELFDDSEIDRAIVFTRTKHGANRVAKFLGQRGVRCNAIHGDKSQTARQRALSEFKSGRLRALIATDIASRGIDVDDVSHVINFDLPNEPESYVHRIGRTARAGANGIALSFCSAEEVTQLRAIERIIRQSVEVHEEHSFHDDRIARQHAEPVRSGRLSVASRSQHRGRNNGRGSRRSGDQRSRRSGGNRDGNVGDGRRGKRR